MIDIKIKARCSSCDCQMEQEHTGFSIDEAEQLLEEISEILCGECDEERQREYYLERKAEERRGI